VWGRLSREENLRKDVIASSIGSNCDLGTSCVVEEGIAAESLDIAMKIEPRGLEILWRLGGGELAMECSK
jgi:hypothetical protein